MEWMYERYYKKNIVREKAVFKFDPNISRCKKNVYLEGYWQSEKYFISIADIIRKEFRIKIPQDRENALLSEQIISSNTVCIHIRRGDYVSNKVTNAYHGVCPLKYYYEGIQVLLKKGIICSVK